MYWIKQLLGNWKGSSKISAAVAVDHVELSSTRLVFGLNLGWRNETHDAIPIKEVRVLLFLHKRSVEPLRCYPLERFEHVIGHQAVQKTPVRPFTLPSGEIHTENLRFICQEVFEIPPGTYAAQIETRDIDGYGYINRVKIRIENEVIYRRSEEWK